MVTLLLYIFTSPTITRRKCEVCFNIVVSKLFSHRARSRFIDYVQRFATADMAETLSSSINGQQSTNCSSSTSSSNQTNGSTKTNATAKNESDDEVLSDFSEDETANMDLE